MKRLFIAASVLAVLLLATVAMVLLVPQDAERLDLILEGKPLNAWLEDLKYGTGDARNQAAEVLRRSGTNALPVLVEMIHSRDSRLRLALVALVRKQSWVKINFVLASERRSLALGAFEALGSLARPALPELRRRPKDKAVLADALRAIMIIESDGSRNP